MGSYQSSVYIGVLAKVFVEKKGKTLRNYCDTCDKTGILSEHCPKCGGKIEKTHIEQWTEIEPYIYKHLSAKQKKAIKRSDTVIDALYEDKIFPKLDLYVANEDSSQETVLIGKGLLHSVYDGIKEISLPTQKAVRTIFNKLKKFGLVKKLEDVRLFQVLDYN